MSNNRPMLVVLAGGSSSRLWPLRDKSLLRFLGKTLLEHQIEAYTKAGFTQIVIVCNQENIAPIKEIVRTSLSEQYPDVSYEFRVQVDPKGMGDALLQLKSLAGQFPVYICQVHDVCDQSLLTSMLEAYEADPAIGRIAGQRRETYFPGGYLVLDTDGKITDVIEKPGAGAEPEGKLVNIVAHIHPNFQQLLDFIEIEYADATKSTDDHYERAMSKLMQQSAYRPVAYTGEWYAVKYPWHVLEVMQFYLKGLQGQDIRTLHIEEGVHIVGPVIIEDGVRIFRGADIRGPVYIGKNSLVGQFAQVRASMISNNCEIGLGSEVNRSYIGQQARLHSSKALDSILADSPQGQHVNLAAGAITANLRADSGDINVLIKGTLISTNHNKFGAVIGSGSFVGINAALMPGVKIGEGSIVGPGTIVDQDIPDRHRCFVRQEKVVKEIRQDEQ